MMLARRIVGSNKGISNILVVVLLILIAIAAIGILWQYTREVIKKSPLEKTICLETGSFSLERACYLNNEEIRVIIARDLDNLVVDKLDVSFSPNQAEWEIKKKKCSDMRLETGVYGEYCKVLDSGVRMGYVFNVSGIEKESSVGVLASIGEVDCELGRINVEASC